MWEFKITPEFLAKLLHQELEAQSWGDIDPNLFREIYDKDFVISNDKEDVESLRTVLRRVINRMYEVIKEY